MVATVLKAGEFAIIGYNGGSTDGTGRPATTDKIHFVLLTAIGSGTTIYITDRTWSGTAFSTSGSDGTFTYTAGADLPAGTVVSITASQLAAAGIDYEHIAGEALYAYQGTNANTPTAFLFALEAGDGNTTFNASLANTGLVAGTNAVSIAYDSGAYSGPTTHAGAFLFNNTPLINSIADSTNWSGEDSTAHTGGQNALEAQVQTGPWLVAPRIDLWGTAAGGGGAIVRTSGDETVSSGTDDYNHAEMYNKLLNGGVSVFWNLRDMAFDTVEGKFFVVDSDVSGGHNRILQGNIADLLGNPGVMPTMITLFSDTSTATSPILQRLDNFEVDTANNIIYFTHGDNLEKIVFNTPNQTSTVLFQANVAASAPPVGATLSPSGVTNPAGSTNNYFNDMVINFTTGKIYLSSTRVGASSGGDLVTKNFIYELSGLATASGTDAFQFNASNTGTARLLPFVLNDDVYNPFGGTSSPATTANQAYFFPQEYGTLDGLAIDPVSNTLYFSTGAILFDHDGDGDPADVIYSPGIIGSYALGANAANGQGAITVIHTQPGGAGSGLYGDLEIDVAAGKWYVTDYNGANGSNEDSHIYQGNLSGGARTQFSQQIGNVEGLSTVGFTINHAPTVTGSAGGGVVTENSNGPPSGNTASVSVFSSVTLDDIDTGPGNELSGAVLRIATNFQSGATHQDFLRINGSLSGVINGLNFSYSTTTGAMVITGQGTVATYKATIELVTFHTSGDDPTAYGTANNRVIALAVSDGLSVSDEIFDTVAVVGVNDAPVNTLPVQAAGTEDVLVQAVTGLSIADVDSDPASVVRKMQVTLSVDIGTLTILTNVSGGIVAGDVTGNGTSSIFITASQNAINATLAVTNATPALSGLTLTNAPNFNGASTLTMITDDQGATGNDPGLTGTFSSERDTDTRAITITAVNDAPTVTSLTNVAATTILEDTPLTAGTETVATLFGGRFSDVLDAQVSGSNPTGSVANTLAGIAITGNGSSGSTGQWQYYDGTSWVNIALASANNGTTISASTAIRFNPALNFNGAAPSLIVVLIDSSLGAVTNNVAVATNIRGGTTRYSTDTLTLTQAVTAVNDAPVNGVPAAQTINEDASRVFNTANGNLITVSDVDLGAGNLQVTLSVQSGTLTLGGIGGLSFSVGDGTADATMTFQGTPAAINAALNGLTYTPTANFNGADAITITTSDLGNTGQDPGTTGDANSEVDTDTVVINVTPVNDAPTVTSLANVAATVILEDTPRTATTETVDTLFGGRFSDLLDGQQSVGNPTGSAVNTLAGIAITANGSSGSTGQWQYYNGASWVNVGTASVSSAVLVAASTAIRFNPALNYNGAAPTLTVALIDSSGGAVTNGTLANVTTRGGTTRYSTDTLVLTQAITAVNDAPTSTGLSGDTASYSEQQPFVALLDVGSNGFLADVDNTTFNTGSLTVAITSGLVSAQDQLMLSAGGTVSFDATSVFVNNSQIATYTGGGAGGGAFVFTFTGSATPAAVSDLLHAIGYTNTGGDVPTAGSRTITWTLVDGSGTANFGADTLVVTTSVTVVAIDDLPVAVADPISTDENVVLTGTVAGNTTLIFNDTDVDGGPKLVATVNGSGATVGTQITLASGALLTVNADGRTATIPTASSIIWSWRRPPTTTGSRARPTASPTH